MHLESLYVNNFKSYTEAQLSFCPRINAFIGNNGSGKTNLLDAVHYLSVSKSYFSVSDRDNIRHGQDYFSVIGQYRLEDNLDACVSLVQKKDQRKILKFNNKEYGRMSEHIGRIPVIMVSPQDQELIYGGGELRRRFLDSVISQFNRSYLEHLIVYNKVLLQRNRLLKQENPDTALIEVFNAQLAEHGTPVFKERKRFVEDFIPLFRQYFAMIAGTGEQADLRYQSQLEEKDFSLLLKESLSKDRILQYTASGIHRDDLELLLDGHSIKKCGSQGQQKSYLLALRLSQLQYTAQVKNQYPILLLDDIFDKLDLERVNRLMQLVGQDQFGQVFLSDTHHERVFELFKNSPVENRIFRIENSVPTPLSTQ